MEFIEKSKAVDLVQSKVEPNKIFMDGYVSDILAGIALQIDLIPRSDVAPVVHGRNLSPLSLFECSVCGWSCGDTVPGDTETYNFCPHCGAKMDVLHA